MLAVFGRHHSGHGLTPSGCTRKLRDSLLPEEEDYINQLFDRLYDLLPKRQRGFVQEHTVPGGQSGADLFFGLAWAESETAQLTHKKDITVFFMGSIENNYTDMEDGEYILEEYETACGGPYHEGMQPPSLDILVQLEPSSTVGYAFIIFDRRYDRITVARDPDGIQKLYWGPGSNSEGVIFSNERSLIESDCTSADEFPAGAVYYSQDGTTEGCITTFGAKVLLHPDLCKVESANNICGMLRAVPSVNDIGTVR